MIPARYTTAFDDLFSYQMGDGPAGAPRFFMARTWIPDYEIVGNKVQKSHLAVVWLLNAMRLAEAKECSEIARNILVGASEDIADSTINVAEEEAIFSSLFDRIVIVSTDDATRILYDLGIPLSFSEEVHGTIEHIDVIPFTVETGFNDEIIETYSQLIPVSNENR